MIAMSSAAGLSYGVCTTPVCNAGSRTVDWMHENTAHTVVSAALVAAVVLPK